MNEHVKNIHMVGIGGTGMCGIAEVLLQQGFTVYGSDMAENAAVSHLRDLGAKIFLGHAADNLRDVQVLVKSTAIKEDNVEVAEARRRRIPVISRAEMLAELMRSRDGIAVAGTHGKTTTTSFIATIFEAAKEAPTVVIGGRLQDYGSNARLGSGKWLIAEADESDGSFLCLCPIVNVVTNIELDHVDFYGNIDKIDAAFTHFMQKIPFYGCNIVCGDDAGVQRLLPHITRPVVRYGLGEENELRAENIRSGEENRFTVVLHNKTLGDVCLAQPGLHNILNALAAIGVALHAGISFEVCQKSLEHFGGVGRRFERKGEKNGVLVVDDYGHHPTEIAATLATAKSCYPNRRLVVAFQPHRFTRTQALFTDFCQTLGKVDTLFLAEIYPAGEKAIEGVSSKLLAEAIKKQSHTDVHYCQSIDDISAQVPHYLQSGDIFLTIGAGNIWRAGQAYLDHGTSEAK